MMKAATSIVALLRFLRDPSSTNRENLHGECVRGGLLYFYNLWLMLVAYIKIGFKLVFLDYG